MPPPPPRVMNDSGGDEEDIWSEEEEPWTPPTSPAASAPEGEEARPLSEAEALRKSVIEAIGRSSPLLKTGLSSSLPWRIEGARLVVPFRSGIEESVVRGSVADIAAKAAELAGRALKVELVIDRPGLAAREERGPEAGKAAPDPADIVERVFRGSRVAPK